MKRIMFWLSIITVIIQIFSCISMGVEIFITPGFNSDVIIIEAYIMGVCLIVESVCALYKIYSSK